MMMMGGMFGVVLVALFCGLAFVTLLGPVLHNQSNETRKQKRKGITKSASEIAAERYAAGDISREEYSEIMDDLEDYSYTNRLQDHR